ncbi:MAG: NAD(+)/NADH kinase [Butyrivibrio sp.]|nr:NAD(+)/NADH kinase [Butyrivibrio sp.]
MEHFFIITNKSKDPELEATNRVCEFLKQNGATCTIFDADITSEKYEVTGKLNIPENAECCIVLGGDGTMLQAARCVFERDIPILGINLGTIGYLAEVEMADLESALAKLLNDEFEIEQRMMLKGVLKTEGKPNLVNYALNDIVIARCSSLKVHNFNIYVNDMLLTSYQADGIIISSPTGSTAYNMSAGGPIVDPKAQILLLTPICPHNLNKSTIVLSEHDRITVEIGKGRAGASQKLEVSLDGGSGRYMVSGDRVDITAADKVTRIVKLRSESFLNTLRKKLV